MTETNADRWIQRVALVTLLVLAVVLLAIGIVLYAPGAHAASHRNFQHRSTVTLER